MITDDYAEALPIDPIHNPVTKEEWLYFPEEILLMIYDYCKNGTHLFKCPCCKNSFANESDLVPIPIFDDEDTWVRLKPWARKYQRITKNLTIFSICKACDSQKPSVILKPLRPYYCGSFRFTEVPDEFDHEKELQEEK